MVLIRTGTDFRSGRDIPVPDRDFFDPFELEDFADAPDPGRSADFPDFALPPRLPFDFPLPGLDFDPFLPLPPFLSADRPLPDGGRSSTGSGSGSGSLTGSGSGSGSGSSGFDSKRTISRISSSILSKVTWSSAFSIL